MKEKIKYLCVQCHQEMTGGISVVETNMPYFEFTGENIYPHEQRIMVCTNPECPNYTLACVPVNFMPKK